MVFIRWPVGSRDNIVTLRVPMAYVPLGTTPRQNNRDPNYREPFPITKGFDINAMLWDMDPLPRDRQLTTEQRNMEDGRRGDLHLRHRAVDVFAYSKRKAHAAKIASIDRGKNLNVWLLGS